MHRTDPITVHIQFSPTIHGDRATKLTRIFTATVSISELLNTLISQEIAGNEKALRHCMVVINDQCISEHSIYLRDGDSIFLLSPISGG